MRQLLPYRVDPVDPAHVYADFPVAVGRPALRLNMISSADGASAFNGLSGGLGGPADKALFAVLRSMADVVLVAAGTVRAEHYGPSSVPIAVVSRSCQLDWRSRLFSEARARPVVITVEKAPADNRRDAAEVADVVVAGNTDVDLLGALRALGERGARSVLCEGGPSLGGQLASGRLIDELCLTLSPKVVGGDAKRILAGPVVDPAQPWALRSLCEDEGFLFLRYRPTE